MTEKYQKKDKKKVASRGNTRAASASKKADGKKNTGRPSEKYEKSGVSYNKRSFDSAAGPRANARRSFDSNSAENSANTVEGRNAVTELLKSERDTDKIYVAKDAGGSIAKITALARERRVPVSYCDRRKLDLMSVTHAHQGVIAFASSVNYSDIDGALALAKERGQAPLLVACDGITDSGNLGAIIRSAEIFGAHGVIISKHGSAGLNAACAKSAAGALEYMPVIRCASMASLLKQLKERGLWIIGTDGSGTSDIYSADFSLPSVVIIGSEGDGMSRLVHESCDFVVKIPMSGKITSLNASAAAAIALYEACRSRQTLPNAKI